MKKIIVSLSLVVCSVVSVLAQIEKSVIVKVEEVPVAVRIAIEKDFSLANEDGQWTLTYSLTADGAKSVATPLTYSYVKKEEGKKIKVIYTAEGKLSSFKGVEKVAEAATTTAQKENS